MILREYIRKRKFPNRNWGIQSTIGFSILSYSGKQGSVPCDKIKTKMLVIQTAIAAIIGLLIFVGCILLSLFINLYKIVKRAKRKKQFQSSSKKGEGSL